MQTLSVYKMVSLGHCHYVVSRCLSYVNNVLNFLANLVLIVFVIFCFVYFFLQNINLCNFLVYKCLQMKISCLYLFSVRSCVFSLLF